MLSEEQIELLGDKYLIGLYQDLEKNVIQDIARRVRKTERLTETAEIMAKSMREQGFSPAKIYAEVMKSLSATPEFKRIVAENTYAYKQGVKKLISETVKAAKEAGDELVASAGEMAFNEDLVMWKQKGVNLKKPNFFTQLTEAFKSQAKEDIKNISNTTAFKSPGIGTVKAAEAYQRSLDMAVLKVATGTFSYRQACNDVIKEFTKSGLRSINYESGRTYQIDTAVRMIVRTATAQLAGKITEANCKSTGQDLVIISQHMGSRDTHVDFQNKVFSLSGKSKKYPDIHAPLGEGCAYGRPEGLQGPNCTHMFYPFWEGISEIPEDIKESDPIEYGGREYTRYEATQKMRAMEREIRALKREKYVAEDYTELSLINAKIKANRAEYMKFSKVMNLKPKENRLLVGGEKSEYAKKYQKNIENIIMPIKLTQEKAGFSFDTLPKLETIKDNKSLKIFAENLIDNLSIDRTNIAVEITNLRGANGACELRNPLDSKRIMYSRYLLNEKDARSAIYKIKTAFHEAFHLSANGLEWDGLDYFGDIKESWRIMEEAFTESAAHYLLKKYGVNEKLTPAYPKELVTILPKLKRLDKYKDCNTIQDFGKIAYEDRRNGTGAIWQGLYEEVSMVILEKDYYNTYHNYIKTHMDGLLDMLLENSPRYKPYKKDMKADIIKALNKNGSNLNGNENYVYYGLLSCAMQKEGVK